MAPHGKHTTLGGEWGTWQGCAPACMRAAGRFAGDSALPIRFPLPPARGAQLTRAFISLRPALLPFLNT